MTGIRKLPYYSTLIPSDTNVDTYSVIDQSKLGSPITIAHRKLHQLIHLGSNYLLHCLVECVVLQDNWLLIMPGPEWIKQLDPLITVCVGMAIEFVHCRQGRVLIDVTIKTVPG